MSRAPGSCTDEKFIMKFVRARRILEEYEGSIEEYWYNIYDLLDESDLMIIQSPNGQPITQSQIKKALSLMVENMSNDGYPLVWRVHNGSLFLAEDLTATPFGIVAYEQYTSFLPKETLKNIFDQSTIKRFEKQIRRRKSPKKMHLKGFDFGGILSRKVLEAKQTVHFRPRIETELNKVLELKTLEHSYANWLRNCILALEPIIRDSPFVRDADLEELVDTLFDELFEALEERAPKHQSFIENESIREWLNYLDNSHRARKNAFDVKRTGEELSIETCTFTMHDVARALNKLQIFSDPFLDWLRRCIIKLEEDQRLNQIPIIHELAERQFEFLEDFAEDCFWCGKKGIESGHFENCTKRNELLLSAGDKKKIFLSYSSEDRDKAKEIYMRLTQAGKEVFFTETELSRGDSIVYSLSRQIAASDYIIVLISKHASRSRWLNEELKRVIDSEFKARDIVLIPVVLDYYPIPSYLRQYHTIRLKPDFEKGIERLIERIKLIPRIDFRLIDEHTFELLIGDLLKSLGFKGVEKEPFYFDRKFDFKANYSYRDPFGFSVTETWLVETKFYRDSRLDFSTLAQAISFLSPISSNFKILLITNGYLTSTSRDWLEKSEKKEKTQVRIFEGSELKTILLGHKKLVEKYFKLGRRY